MAYLKLEEDVNKKTSRTYESYIEDLRQEVIQIKQYETTINDYYEIKAHRDQLVQVIDALEEKVKVDHRKVQEWNVENKVLLEDIERLQSSALEEQILKTKNIELDVEMNSLRTLLKLLRKKENLLQKRRNTKNDAHHLIKELKDVENSVNEIELNILKFKAYDVSKKSSRARTMSGMWF